MSDARVGPRAAGVGAAGNDAAGNNAAGNDAAATVDPERRRRLSLRTRLVLLTTIGLAVGLVIGGVVLTVVLRGGLERASDDAARQTAHEVAVLIDENQLPDPIPAGGTTIVQVIDQQGRVLAASTGADRLVAALPPDELAAALAGPITVAGSRFGVQGPVRVVAQQAGSPGEAGTVLVAAPAGDIDEAVRVIRTALIGGFAVLLALLAAVSWRLIGATLRPVEVLRRGAEQITGTGSAGTLPVPDTADEIRRLAETLNGMLDRLEHSRRRQRVFVADAAHELRSPLTSLRVQLEVGAATGDDPDPGDLLAEVDRMTGLVDDLLLLARVDDAGPPPMKMLDMSTIAADCADRYAAQRVPVRVAAPASAVVRGNPAALTRVLANLLDNAVRHASSQVVLTVEAPTDGEVLVTVTDDGPGIPAADRERVFQRFARLHDARDRDSGGSGLGLAIVRELLRQQGASITLSDAVDAVTPPGLRVEIRLPGAGSARP